MFDNIICDYPLSGYEDLQHETFQTKSLYQTLTNYRISSDGRLMREITETQEIPDDEREYPDPDDPISAFLQNNVRTVQVGWVDHNYHGRLTFYTSIEGYWIEFLATFIMGQLDHIMLHKSYELPNDWSTYE